MATVRYLTGYEARDLGVLLEVNRRLLHPRKLALEAEVQVDGDPVHPVFFTPDGVDALHRLVNAIADHEAGDEILEQARLQQSDLALLEKRIDEADFNQDRGVFHIQDWRDDPEGIRFTTAEEWDGVTLLDRDAKAEAFESLKVRDPQGLQELGS
jgi:hypothetical protein